jgi:hypothetical protein
MARLDAPGRRQAFRGRSFGGGAEGGLGDAIRAAEDLFAQRRDGVAWESKPSSYIVATDDHAVHPELQRFAATRMRATMSETNSSYVPMLSNPGFVIDVIRTAALAVR